MIAPVQPWRWIRLEIGLVVNGGIQYALFIDHPLFWPALGLTTLLILALTLWPAGQSAPSQPQSVLDAGAQAAYWKDVARHVYALLPLWAGHIALGREQIDEAASHLTMRFDSMLHQLGRENPGQQAPPYALADAEASKSLPLEAIPKPVQLQQHLRPMLQQLHQSGLQLEALAQTLARPGGAASQSEQISTQLRHLLLQLEMLDQDINTSCLADQLGLDDSRADFDLQTTTEDVLTNLQFQDRVSQILSLVQNDVWQLETMLHQALNSEQGLPAPPDTQAWLSALKSSYTTHEQRALHSRESDGKAAGPSDITFF
jgi:methyl-accepting chemotaxis protein